MDWDIGRLGEKEVGRVTAMSLSGATSKRVAAGREEANFRESGRDTIAACKSGDIEPMSGSGQYLHKCPILESTGSLLSDSHSQEGASYFKAV